ncbi:DUF502 domain-containing protein [Derxia gummosa]|uniref:DUF502 domain-containing protein n=1 Tax=Derxia gummosa DSM 723 TaxID=1121388 RepID=A0A8B6X0U1_9BURK|nr:DUF502 domain-containing protein [Derxia gummosa]
MKKYFVTGLLILVPLVVTVWVLRVIVGTLDQVRDWLPPSLRSATYILEWPGTGVLLAVTIVFVTGLLAHNFIGRRLLDWWEKLLARIPFVSSIYSSVKQVSDTVLSPNGQAFRKAVLVEFPRQGAWTIGFLVGSPGGEVAALLGDDQQTVFVPTAPNPTSGYLIVLPPAQIRELEMSIDEALKFVISLGVVAPGKTPGTTIIVPPAAA